MRIIGERYAAGDVLVARRFGSSKIIQLVEGSRRGQFGLTVRGVRRNPNPASYHMSPAMEIHFHRLMERKLLLGRGWIVFLWFYQPKDSRVLNWLLGKPRMYAYRSLSKETGASFNEACGALSLDGDIGPDFSKQVALALSRKWHQLCDELPPLWWLRFFFGGYYTP